MQIKGQLSKIGILTSLLILILACLTNSSDRWQAPFPTAISENVNDTVLNLQTILGLVANNNPILASLSLRHEAGLATIDQASIGLNPELEFELEEFNWSNPGLNESAISILLSQEFELFGKKEARMNLAEIKQQELEFESQLIAFDLFLETSRRYYRLVKAQEQFHLSEISVRLDNTIVETIENRIAKGAAQQSELLMAQLEMKRAELGRTEAMMNIETASIELTSLWTNDLITISVIAPAEEDFNNIIELLLDSKNESTRAVLALNRQQNMLKAELKLAATEAKPNLTLAGGVKRAISDNSNSFIFGLALPLPFTNQNRGLLNNIEANISRIDFDLLQQQNENNIIFASGIAKLRHLMAKHTAIDNELLPIAEKAYSATNELYQSGRLPYTSLLEANRSLVELRFEHNEILLSLREQIIELEKVGGIIFLNDKDSNNE